MVVTWNFAEVREKETLTRRAGCQNGVQGPGFGVWMVDCLRAGGAQVQLQVLAQVPRE